MVTNVKRYEPDDGFGQGYLQEIDSEEQLEPQPVYLCSDVDALIATARAVVDAHSRLGASDPAVRKIDLANAVESLRRALP
jgi:hypothetical protein